MEWELTKRQNLTKPPKPTALFLYTDLKKAAPPTLMSISKITYQIAIFHINIPRECFGWLEEF